MSAFVLVFGVALLLAVLTSALSARSPLSTTTVFLAVGLAAGPLGANLIEVDSITVEHAAEIALFAILFTDGQHAPARVLRQHWRVPTRALLLGMPLTFVIVTALGHWVARPGLGAGHGPRCRPGAHRPGLRLSAGRS